MLLHHYRPQSGILGGANSSEPLEQQQIVSQGVQNTALQETAGIEKGKDER